MTAERSVKVQRAPGGGGGWLAARFKCQYSQQLLQVSYKYLTVGGWGADVRKFIALFVSSLLCHREARSAVATHSTSCELAAAGSGQASGTAPAGRRLSSGLLRGACAEGRSAHNDNPFVIARRAAPWRSRSRRERKRCLAGLLRGACAEGRSARNDKWGVASRSLR